MNFRRLASPLLLAMGSMLLASCGGGSADAPSADVQSASKRSTAQAMTPARALTATWGASVALPLVPVSGAVLASGKLLFWAADAPNNILYAGGGHTYTSLFDPSTGSATLNNVTVSGQNAFCIGTARLGDGRLLVNGGDNPGLTSLYDPVTDTWSASAAQVTPRGYNASVPLADGSVLTMGGSWSGAQVGKPAELFTLAGGWKSLPGISTTDTSFLTADPKGYYRADNHMWLIPTGNGKVLHAGPSRQMHWLDTTGTGTVTAAGTRADDGDSMNGNAVMYDAGKILAVGGSPTYDGSDSKSSAFIIDTTQGLASTRRIASMSYQRMFHNSVVLPNGQVVVIGGQTHERVFADDYAVLVPEIFDPQSETFTPMPAMAVPRSYHSIAMLLADGRVVSAGGGLCNCAGDHANLQMLSPPYLFNVDGTAATRPVISSAPAQVGYGDSAGVTTDSPVTSFALVRLGAATHTVNNDQRRVALAYTDLGGNSYRVAIPTNPGILLPGQWMLFALNAQGTPSIAKIVTVTSAGAPVLTNPGNVTALQGNTVRLAVAATSASGTLSYSAIGLPSGFAIDPVSGVITGTATSLNPGQLVSITASNGTQSVTTDILINVVSPRGSGSGLQSQSFSNLTINGTPVSSAVETPNRSWDASTGAQSVQWTGFIEAAATGGIQLQALSAQGARVWFDNQLVIDTISTNGNTTNTAGVNVSSDKRYAVFIEYIKPAGAGSIAFNWTLPGASMVPVPSDRLYAGAVPATTNLAQGRTATQNSMYGTNPASRAVDGSTNGQGEGTVSHTAAAATQDWWQVDLGAASQLSTVRLWNRTDCCIDRLQNFVVLLSPNDMTGRSLDQLLADTSITVRRVNTPLIAPFLDVPIGALGRYLRVQLIGIDFLSLAEVQAFGSVGAAPTFAGVAAQQSTVGIASSVTVTATSASGSALSYGATGLPPGLAINAASGVISGSATVAGTYSATVIATDGNGQQASTSVAWTVLDVVPTVVSQPAPVSPSGGTVSYNPVLGSGAASRYSWNFGDGTAATAPSTSAQTTHAFTAPGIYSVTFTITTADGRVATQTFMQAIYPSGTSALSPSSSNVLVEPRSGASSRIWAVNADNDTVSVLDATSYAKSAEIPVGAGPRTLALASDGSIWVTNHDAGSISVVNAGSLAVSQTIALPRGSQPYGIVVSPADGSVFVVLEATGQLLKLSRTGAVSGTLAVGTNPRHVAITAAGDQVMVSRFITRPLPGESTATVQTVDASGNKVGGEVILVNAATLAIKSTVVLAHSEKVDAENQGRGIPNYLGAAAISPDGKSAWVPSKQDNIKRGTLRDGNALNFQSTVRSISSRIDLGTLAEDYAARVDHDNAGMASAAVYHPTGAYLFVALETNRQVAVLDAAGKRELFRFDVGFAPQGLAVSTDGLTLYANNFTSRSVSVVDLTPLVGFGRTTAPALATLATVANEKLSAAALRGKVLFYDARDTRLARDSYMSCASCHNDGGHDGRVWDFSSQGEGLRNTIPLKGRAGMGHGFLHWSANFDEVQDFEGQIRTLAGGTGLMADADFNTGTRNQPLGDKKAGVSADLDALAAYMATLSTFAPSPYRNADGTMSAAAQAGKAIFQYNGCASCHGGTGFTNSGDGTQLQNIGTLKATSGKRLGGTLTGIDIPTLRDVWATGPYLHDGSAAALTDAVRAHNNVRLSAADLTSVSAYLREIGSDEAAPVTSNPPVYTACGGENSTCTLPAGSTGTVVYGANGNYARLSGVSGNIACTNVVFGDPAVGLTKSCSFVVDTPAVTPVGAQYCAQQGGSCTLPVGTTATAIFGIGGNWATRTGVTGSFACTAAAFASDPAPTQTKSCSYQVTAVASGNDTGLVAQYFPNGNLQGTPTLTRVEAPSFNWGSAAPAPGLPADGYSVRWTGTLVAPAAGLSQLQTVADDGVRVWVDGKLLIDAWGTRSTVLTSTAALSMVAGQKAKIVIEYFEYQGNASIQLNWLPTGASAMAAVPKSALVPGVPISAQNIALGMTATQSSTAGLAVASRAVDGNPSGDAAAASLSDTTSEVQPWWQVDLGSASRIDLVQLSNRTDCCADKLQKFSVFVSQTDMTGRTLAQLTADSTITVRQVSATSWGMASMGIPVNSYGRYVRVQLSGTGDLALGEVQVYGAPNGNLALGKTATQVSMYGNNPASRAVDGSTSGQGETTVSHTASAAPQDWWQVDLGAQSRIDQITLWNRTDCCTARLHWFTVFIGPADMTGRTMAQLQADPTIKAVVFSSADVLPNLNIPLAGTSGRFVRVQLINQDFLSLAEVQVFGSVTAGN